MAVPDTGDLQKNSAEIAATALATWLLELMTKDALLVKTYSRWSNGVCSSNVSRALMIDIWCALTTDSLASTDSL